MSTQLFYFSGTGNTLAIAKAIAAGIGNAAVMPVTKASPVIGYGTDTVGIIFPVHGWGMPKIMGDFVDRMENLAGKYVFGVCNYGGTLFSSLKTLERRLQKKGIKLDAGFALRMPVNYIPIFTVLSAEKEKRILAKAKARISFIASAVKDRRKSKIEQWNVPVISFLLMALNESMNRHMNDQDKAYHVDDRCNGCRTCERVCPVSNITMAAGRPVWNHSCLFCLACLHWCPQSAIQYGKVPEKRGRYHNPEISLQEMLTQQAVRKDVKQPTR
jgi:ferredoxin